MILCFFYFLLALNFYNFGKTGINYFYFSSDQDELTGTRFAFYLKQ